MLLPAQCSNIINISTKSSSVFSFTYVITVIKDCEEIVKLENMAEKLDVRLNTLKNKCTDA